MFLPAFTSVTTAEDVAIAFAAQIRGKNILITGTSINGIGFEAARVLAKYANLETGRGGDQEEVMQIYAAHGDCPHRAVPFDEALLPKLLAARTVSYTPRVVLVSSDAHAFGAVDLSTVAHPDAATYTSVNGYFQAKAANILFAIELAKRGQGKIDAYSIHPGVTYTNFVQKDGMKQELIAVGPFLTPDGLPNKEKVKWKTLSQGAATTVAAAFDTRLGGKSGAYVVDCVEANNQIAPHSSDPASFLRESF
ncbi:hypothetical protein K438DRAFT_1986660 [Mycena galopus ATCC 62051]|nr:hypothetical protein K438DRAFT_1986660 [Mycena galopus ATCC 62051]